MAIIMVDTFVLLVKCHNSQIELPIAVVIAPVNPHATMYIAGRIVRDGSVHRHVFQASGLTYKQIARHFVICDGYHGPAGFVQVRTGDAESFTGNLMYSPGR